MADAGVPVPVGRKALELLSVLAKAEGALVTKDELMAAVWPNAIVEDNAIQAQITALRKALGTDAELLSTVHGLGYRLAAARMASASGAGIDPVETQPAALRRWAGPVLLMGLALVAVCGAGFWLLRDYWPGMPRPSETRVAVLPFKSLELDGLASAPLLPLMRLPMKSQCD